MTKFQQTMDLEAREDAAMTDNRCPEWPNCGDDEGPCQGCADYDRAQIEADDLYNRDAIAQPLTNDQVDILDANIPTAVEPGYDIRARRLIATIRKLQDYLVEKNEIIKAYAGPTGMTPEDVAFLITNPILGIELTASICDVALAGKRVKRGELGTVRCTYLHGHRGRHSFAETDSPRNGDQS
jgi:hypothetical protein